MTISFPQRSHIAGLMVGIFAISAVWFVFSTPSRVTTFLGGVGLESSAVGASMIISPSEISVAKGEEFTFQVEVEAQETLERHRAIVHFDTRRLQVVEVKVIRNADGTEPVLSYDNVNGTLSVLNSHAEAGLPKVLVNVKMRALQTLGKTPLSLQTGGAESFAYTPEGKNILTSVQGATVNILLQK